MAKLEILQFPDPRLRQRARAVETFDAELQRLIGDMFETMYAAPGVGLAATQVGIAKRLSVIDVSEEKNERLVIINPEILELGEEVELQEGCLSVPGHYDTVHRAQRCRVRALDREGQSFEIEGEGLLAQCLQHEIDHLHGRLYIDQLSALKRNRIRKKLLKEQRQAERG